MKINNKILILLACLIITSCPSNAQDGLILPMPGQIPGNQNTSSDQNKRNTQKQQNTNKQQNNRQNNSANTGQNKGQINDGNSKDSILPMPNLNNNKASSSDTKRGNKSSNQSGNKNNINNSDGQTFISLPASNNNKQQNQNQNKQQNQNQNKQQNQNQNKQQNQNQNKQQNQNQNKQQNQKQDQKKKNNIKDQTKPVPQQNSNKRITSSKVPLSIDDDDSGFFSKDLEIPDWDDELETESSPLPPPPPSAPPSSDFGFESDSDSDSELSTSSGETDIDEMLDTAKKTETTVAQDSSGETIKVFPKDTGAAIFMVMKSWNCEDYDVVSLINQALDVYGKEAGEEYKIQGLENYTKGLTVSVEEEDITYDELLDIIAAKSGNDWGCDLANKVIYIYPKGIKTESFLSWEDE